MIQKIRNQNIPFNAFTLIELVIVLIIIWIMLMATMYFSWEQVQKVKNKTVKEAILAEMQSRYSRNLWSSSFAWIMYESMDVSFSWNKINFKYKGRNNTTWIENTFTDRFEIKEVRPNYEQNDKRTEKNKNISLKYTPYRISCNIWEDKDYDNVAIIIRVNDSKDYCFEITQKNCRLIEMSESKCKNLTDKKTN